jgi:hypothetical protein
VSIWMTGNGMRPKKAVPAEPEWGGRVFAHRPGDSDARVAPVRFADHKDALTLEARQADPSDASSTSRGPTLPPHTAIVNASGSKPSESPCRMNSGIRWDAWPSEMTANGRTAMLVCGAGGCDGRRPLAELVAGCDTR